MANAPEVDRALDRFGDELFTKAHVVGLGRVPSNDEATDDDDPWCLAVYVERQPARDLPAEQRIPETIRLEDGVETVEIPTRIIVEGIVRLE